MINKFKFFLLTLLTLKFLLLGLLGYSYYNAFFKTHVTEETVVIIPKGTSINRISEILYNKQVIKNQTIFALISKLLAFNGKYLKSGEYDLTPGMRMIEIINKVIKGDVIIHKLTIPEGYTNPQIFSLLDSSYGLTGDIDPSQYHEGYLLPETYTYQYDDSKTSLLHQMQAEMEHDLQNLLSMSSLPPPLKNTNELLTLASIVEKETGIGTERSRIARVYLNRLLNGIPLQADPTVIYGITGGNEAFARKVTYIDLENPSPYNTYKIPGLPPTPIANPGIDSIKAVLNPINSDELYFVADGKGGHKFSTNYRDHLNNVKSYRNSTSNKNSN